MTIDDFARLLLSSGLLSEERESLLRAESRADSAVGYASFLVAKNELTDWQADKLIRGQWKGFFVDQYKFLSRLGDGDGYARYRAQDIQTGMIATLRVYPPKVNYDVEPPDDDPSGASKN
jgi:hypothetical protein